MAVTPQTNTDLGAIAEALRSRDDFIICGHVSPDGDCLGSQLGLAAALKGLGKRVTCLLAKDEPIDERLGFLPGAAELVPAASFDGIARTFVAVDVPTRERIGEAAAALLEGCDLTVTVDHHAVDSTMTDLVYVDPDAASTTMLVWELAGLMGAERAGDVAQCCYTGLVTDTGRFQYQNTDAAAMRAASEMVEAGADPASVSRAIFQNRTLPSVRLEGIAVERMTFGAGGAYALSWLSCDDFEATGAVKADAEPIIDRAAPRWRRARGLHAARAGPTWCAAACAPTDDTDVAAVARSFGGGGHVAAAGFTLSCTLDEARRLVDEALAATFASDEEGACRA